MKKLLVIFTIVFIVLLGVIGIQSNSNNDYGDEVWPRTNTIKESTINQTLDEIIQQSSS